MKKQSWIVASLATLSMLAFALVGCQNIENNSVTTPDLGAQPDFIVGDAEIDDWGGQYGEGNSYFMLNIPVSGAMQIAYTIQGGGSYNLFGINSAASKQEIGLWDGDLLDSVCVTYDGSDAFSAMLDNAQESWKRDFLQYQRLNDDGSVSEWWPNNAGFEFSGDTTTVCTVSDGVVQVTEVEGPFEKPQPASASCPLTSSGNGDTDKTFGPLTIDAGTSLTVTMTTGTSNGTLIQITNAGGVNLVYETLLGATHTKTYTAATSETITITLKWSPTSATKTYTIGCP